MAVTLINMRKVNTTIIVWIATVGMILGEGCVSRMAAPSEASVLPDPIWGKVWLVNHWAFQGERGVPPIHHSTLVTQSGAGDGNAAVTVCAAFNVHHRQPFQYGFSQCTSPEWSKENRWPMYYRSQGKAENSETQVHFGLDHFSLYGIHAFGSGEELGMDIRWPRVKTFSPVPWAAESGGIHSLPPIWSNENQEVTSISVFAPGVEELEHGSTRFFLDVHYHSGEWLRLYGLKNAWGDPATGEFMKGSSEKGWQQGKGGLQWQWPVNEGFAPMKYPAEYRLTGEMDHRILPRQEDQSIVFGRHHLWMGAVEVWSADSSMRLGYGNLCLMTRQ